MSDDDIDAMILDAMVQAGPPVYKPQLTRMIAAGIAAAVRLSREPAKPPHSDTRDHIIAELAAAIAVAETRLAWVDWLLKPHLGEMNAERSALGRRLDDEAEKALAAYRRLKEHSA